MGAAVMVVENGYVEFRNSRKTFAISLNHHNGAGHWPDGGMSRAHMLNIELKPWRTAVPHGDIVLLPQRGVGPPGVAMPRNWIAEVQSRIAKLGLGRRVVRVRPHPGGAKSKRTLEQDLEGAAACVVWASGAGIKALALGVPVVHEFPKWIGAVAGSRGIESIRAPRLGDRQAMLESVARAQWTVEEVSTGAPMCCLLDLHDVRSRRRAS
jgi:hypothetical protein